MSHLREFSFDVASIANLKQQERHFFQTHDLQALLGCYIEQFLHYFNEMKFIQAMTALHHAEQLMDELQLPQYRLRLMKMLGMAVTFNYKVDETKARIEQDLPFAKMQGEYELLGVYYQILSYLYLKEKNYQRAIDYAKMAYYFVEDKELEDYTSLCNAQMQLVISLLDGRYTEEAESYVNYYKWRLEHCRTAGEKLLVTVIGATIMIQHGEVEKGLRTYKKVLPLFAQPEAVLYATYLSEHIQTQLQFIKTESYSVLVEEVRALLKSSVLRYQWAYRAAGTYEKSETEQTAYPLHHFLQEGQGFFNQTEKGEFLYCTHIQLKKMEHLDHVDWMYLMAVIKDKLEQEITRQVGDKYIFAQLHENTMMIVTRFPHVEQEVVEAWCSRLIEAMTKELHFELKEDVVIVALGDSKEMDSRDFFALYSRTIAKIYNSFEERK
ncbi:MAG: hypothetical protein ACI33P_14450 [Lysinibacillus sp.]